MSIARSVFRLMRRLPILRGLGYFAMREGRNLVWRFRPTDKVHSDEIPQAFLNLVTANLPSEGPASTLVEIGSGDGRILRRLARTYPGWTFIGIDLQQAAIQFGTLQVAADGFSDRVRLLQGSCLAADICPPCDYLISRTALIYLNDAEIRTFLCQTMRRIRKGLILQEVVSTTAVTERSHFFAHPLAKLIAEIGRGDFAVTEQILDYHPWKGPRWTGANLIVRRQRSERAAEDAYSVT